MPVRGYNGILCLLPLLFIHRFFMKTKLATFLFMGLLIATPSFVFAEQTDVDPAGDVNPCADISHNVRFGSRDVGSDTAIAMLQDFLSGQSYLKGASTGFFGKQTLVAVKKFQLANDLTPTGYVGALTRAKIKDIDCATDEHASSVTPTTSITPTTPTTPTASTAALTATLVANTAFPNQSITVNGVHQKVGSFVLTNQSTTNALRLRQVDVRLLSNIFPSSGEFSNLAVYQDGTQLGSTIVSLAGVNSIVTNVLVLAGATTTLDVYTDVGGGVGSFSTAVGTIGTDEVTSDNVNTTAVAGQTVTVHS